MDIEIVNLGKVNSEERKHSRRMGLASAAVKQGTKRPTLAPKKPSQRN